MKDQINFNDFVKVDLRVGTVVAAEVPEGSKSVIKLTVDFGEELGEKTIFSGIKEWYSPEDLIGKQLPFVVNLPAKKIGDLGESQGMILAAAPMKEGKKTAVLLTLTEEVPNGTELI